MVDFSLFARAQKIYINQRKNSCDLLALTDRSIPICSAFKEIHVAKLRTTRGDSRIKLDDTMITCLGKASEGQKLPNLSSMIIDGHNRNLSQLFKYKWPAISRLAVSNIQFDETSTEKLAEHVLPQLESLKLEGNQPILEFTELSQNTINLQEISLASVQYENSNIAEAIRRGSYGDFLGFYTL